MALVAGSNGLEMGIPSLTAIATGLHDHIIMAVAHTNIGTGAAKVYCHKELTIGSLTQSGDTIAWARLGIVKD